MTNGLSSTESFKPSEIKIGRHLDRSRVSICLNYLTVAWDAHFGRSDFILL